MEQLKQDYEPYRAQEDMNLLFSVFPDRDFGVQDAKLQLFREQDNPDKFRLSLNGQISSTGSNRNLRK